jgi:beta-N-acetylhexosaminidase
MLRAFVCGVAGPKLSQAEQDFLRSSRPSGVILFSRNCQSEQQIRRLIGDVQQAIGDSCLVLIDQEGGRVQRLRPPIGRALPAGATYAALYRQSPDKALRAARSIARLMAHDLSDLGINTNCTPVLDVPVVGAHDIIGDRALGADVETVSALGRAIAEGHMAGGVIPVMKHIPGHGRGSEDSHLKLPIVEASHAALSKTDFATFKALNDLPAAMTAHIVYSALDPSQPASTSPTVIESVVRGEIGFQGLLMSDDISMKALSGSIKQRTADVLAAGCDLALHCNGDFQEMQQVAAEAPVLEGTAQVRLDTALNIVKAPQAFDIADAKKHLDTLLGAPIHGSESV